MACVLRLACGSAVALQASAAQHAKAAAASAEQ